MVVAQGDGQYLHDDDEGKQVAQLKRIKKREKSA
jgi:hypothetical protein